MSLGVMKKIKTYNPADNSFLKEYQLLDSNQIDNAIEMAHNAFISYRKTAFSKRKEWMLQVADILERDSVKYGKVITSEMGKTLNEAIGEVKKCAWVCRFYAEQAEAFLKDEMVPTEARKSKISYRPLGIVFAVMPWNFPYWQVFRFVAPALMAGNVGLLKHASNVPESALSIQSIIEEAGFPAGVFTTLIIGSDQVGSVIENNNVKAVTLTGSDAAGSAVASRAGINLKKSVLELGGSDAYIVLEDADLELAADQCFQSRILNAGQSCIGAKRFIIVEKVYVAWLEKFKTKMENAIMGNPFGEVDLGPLAREDLRDEVHNQVIRSVENGAEIILGGYIPDEMGCYYPPTILTEVSPGMPAYEDEIFGPVASVIKVKDEAEAIQVANDSRFGLGACVFTSDIERGERIATEDLEAGCCFVNQFVKSDPRLPFGGIKTSGYGRELGSHGIREFVNIKTVWIQ